MMKLAHIRNTYSFFANSTSGVCTPRFCRRVGLVRSTWMNASRPAVGTFGFLEMKSAGM